MSIKKGKFSMKMVALYGEKGVIVRMTITLPTNTDTLAWSRMKTDLGKTVKRQSPQEAANRLKRNFDVSSDDEEAVLG